MVFYTTPKLAEFLTSVVGLYSEGRLKGLSSEYIVSMARAQGLALNVLRRFRNPAVGDEMVANMIVMDPLYNYGVGYHGILSAYFSHYVQPYCRAFPRNCEGFRDLGLSIYGLGVQWFRGLCHTVESKPQALMAWG